MLRSHVTITTTRRDGYADTYAYTGTPENIAKAVAASVEHRLRSRESSEIQLTITSPSSIIDADERGRGQYA